MDHNYCIVLTTFETDAQAIETIDILLKEKLAACVQRIPIRSQYFWDGEIQDDAEVLVLFKTRDDLYDKLEEELERVHPYDTPEILRINVADGLNAYLQWISEVTKKHE